MNEARRIAEVDPAVDVRLDVHVHPVRVYYEDTDAGGIVYYANYLRFAERARTEMLRDLGVENSAVMERDGIAFAVRSCSIDYLRPARLDDSLDVHTRVLAIGGASLGLEQVVQRGEETLVRMEIRLVCMHVAGDEAGRPSRIPPDVRHALEAATGLESQK